MKMDLAYVLLAICAIFETGYGHGHSDSGHAHGGFSEQAGNEGLGGHSGADSGNNGDDGHGDHHVDYYAYPKYKFEYGVQDHHTGDNHNHWEHRDGDSVKGGYTIVEPDGTKRIVEYAADKHSGFHAIVTKIGHPDHSSGGGVGNSEAGGDNGHHGFGFTHGK